MTRRETIVIAAVINAALLIVLFISSIHREGEQATIPTPPLAKVEDLQGAQIAQRDVIDQVLKELAQATKPSMSAEGAGVANKSDFVQLKKERPVKIASVKGGEVVVKKGDALEKIARDHGVSVEAIMQLNQLNSSLLHIGQVLQIPGEKKGNERGIDEERGEVFYTVKSGDNPWTIAAKNQIKVEELLKLNGLTDEKSKQLHPGDQLRIR